MQAPSTLAPSAIWVVGTHVRSTDLRHPQITQITQIKIRNAMTHRGPFGPLDERHEIKTRERLIAGSLVLIPCLSSERRAKTGAVGRTHLNLRNLRNLWTLLVRPQRNQRTDARRAEGRQRGGKQRHSR